MQIGLIGLGRMGGNMVLKLLAEGHEVVAWNRSSTPVEELKFKIQPFDETQGKSSKFKVTDQNLKFSGTIEELVQTLKKPRVVWAMVTVGSATQTVLDEVIQHVEANDIVIDGSNSFYKDTERRYNMFTQKRIRYLGMGVAGGIKGPTEGYALMAGGDKSAYDYVIPILDTLVAPKAGHGYFGAGGAGHFVKMMHNGIEYGYMQAIGEGFAILEHAPYKYDLSQIAKLWAKSSLVSGFMMDRAVEALEKDPHMEQLVGVIDATGEGQWAVETAKELNIPVEVLEASYQYRVRSKTDLKIQQSFTARMIAALRFAFGAHKIHKKEEK